MLDLTQSQFSGHETFAFRFGWLPKGVWEVKRDATVFAREDAMVTLGVGKNMVKSIRHWALAAELIAPTSDEDQDLAVTDLGRLLLSKEEGHDPYLEDPGSLWLLHWKICTSRQKATTWRWAFGYWSQTEFTREGMVDELLSLVGRKGRSRANRNSLDRDVETFLHTYVAPKTTKGTVIEDSLDCPLVDLRLIRRDEVSDRFEFVRGPRASLPDRVLCYAILDFWDRFAPKQESLQFETLLYGEEAPGRVFRLTESAFAQRVEQISAWSGRVLAYDATAGMRQIYRRGSPDKLGMLFPRATGRRAA